MTTDTSATYPFFKGHGTENDFVLLPDPEGQVHGDLSVERVRALCNRRAGIGGDGVLRVIRTTALDPSTPGVAGSAAEWFMDYRNADGSVSEMCGNGVRVFARQLLDQGLAKADGDGVLQVGTRDGDKQVVVLPDGRLRVDLGEPTVGKQTQVGVAEQHWPATEVRTGNPHAVAFVSDLADAGDLLRSPSFDPDLYPDGVNVEFVVWRARRHLAMRVYERGAGETRSCGTGAAAAMTAAAVRDGLGNPPLVDTTYRVDVPGGTLAVTWTSANRLLLAGPAVIVAQGDTSL